MDASEDSLSSDGDGSLVWGWVGGLAVVGIAVVVLAGALLRTPGTPDCEAVTIRGRLLFCPWYRSFVRETAMLFGIAALAFVPVGLVVGLGRALLGRS